MSPRQIDERVVRQAPRSRDGLLQLLFEGLDWPRPGGMEIEEIPLLPWTPEELHLDPEAVAKLTKIEQLPRLTSDQPFGVFILSFDGGRLPVGAVRRVVNQLVRKKRARREQATSLWDLEDLVFFCQAGEDVDVLHVVAFRESESRPVMKVISWDSASTDNRIRLVATANLPALSWPGEDVDPTAWRDRWNSGFTATYRQSIKSAATLAQRMAEVASTVRDEVRDLYEVETADGPLRQLFVELKQSLRSDLDPAAFADMYAQTMVYGLLSARVTNPEDFTPDSLDAALTFENPLLDALYASFRQQGAHHIDVDEFGLHDLAELLAGVDVDELLADFGDENRRDDPVVFFYEEFLEQYDPDQKRELGTYYTPVPVVRAIVRLTDQLLEELGLPEGVADTTTWREYSRRAGVNPPPEVDPEQSVLRAIDPATGTGTFLLEWMRQGLRRLGEASAQDQAALVSGVDAFEISLSSYAVAHLKTSLELPQDLRSKHRMNILLTDTLAGMEARQLEVLEGDPIAEEGQRAQAVKFSRHHNVVIGNPPYLRSDRGSAGGWIVHPPDGGRSLFDDVLEPARESTIFSHLRSLSNLYVYFWRWAIWKAFEQSAAGPAIVGFITASSWLTGPGFLGLRELARRLADDIYIVDLGGDNIGARTEENVFDIQTPVAIAILVRRGASERTAAARAHYMRLTGTRQEKLGALAEVDLSGTWQDAPRTWHAPLIPATGRADWLEFPLLADLLPWQQPGCIVSRTWPIATTRETLEERWSQFLEADNPEERAKIFHTAKSGRNIHTKVPGLPRLVDLEAGTPPSPVVRYAFRSFDRQWIFDDPRLLKTESPSLWASRSPHQVFMTTNMTGRLGSGPAATAATAVPDFHHFCARGGKDVLPLYRDQDGTPNVDPAALTLITDTLGTHTVPEDLFAYCYGVLAGGDYTTRFLDELDTPGPRIPLTSDPGLFAQMVEMGKNLLWLHTFGERFRDDGVRTDLSVPDEIEWIAPVRRMPETLGDCQFDSASETLFVGDGTLAGVRDGVWQFEVSGLQVLRKWLGYRTVKGTGRAAGTDRPLDQIRPMNWHTDWHRELRELVYVLTATLDYLPAGTELLELICSGPLISALDLPPVQEHLRKPPKIRRGSEAQLNLEP